MFFRVNDNMKYLCYAIDKIGKKMSKMPTNIEFEKSSKLYRKLRFKISFPEKRWLMDATGWEDYLSRMHKLAGKHKVKIEE